MPTIVQREVRRRGVFGKLFKLLFVLFNLLMLVWVVMALMLASDTIGAAGSEAERAGGTLGATVGIGLLLFLWAVGDVILGMLTFFTRGRAELVTEERP